MSILKCQNVSFSFGNRTILENASFVMQKGEHIGLIGLNGEGKSTFIKMITGELTPDDGKIRCFDQGGTKERENHPPFQPHLQRSGCHLRPYCHH